MSAATISPLVIYTESTPNPETMKFVMNRMLTNHVCEYRTIEDASDSPLALDLFAFPYIKNIFYSSNFITLTKTADTEWDDVILLLKDFIKDYINAGKPIFNETTIDTSHNTILTDDSDTVIQIKNILDTYVRPAVEMDGGNIIFRSFKNGIVTLGMQGSCSGCPSSTLTLKAGIEGMLKRMMPEVQEVVAEAM